MSISLSNRSAVSPFLAMDLIARVATLRASGRDIVSLAVGQPSDPVAPAVIEASQRALRDGVLSYTDALGHRSLREALARYYAEQHGLDVSPERILVTSGSSAGFHLAFTGAFDAGQRIAIARPGYPAYRNIIASLGLSVVEIPLTSVEPDLTPEKIDAALEDGPIHGLLVANPSNPTGTVMAKDAFQRLLDHCRARGITVISDEIYHRLNHVGRDTCALEIDDDVIVINSFSKYYCMTGWRIGWMVLPQRMMRAFESLQQNLYISAPELSQVGAEAALGQHDYYDAIARRYAENRTRIVGTLADLNIPLASPANGAFYAWCDVSAHTNDSLEFSARMLEEIGVAAPSGLDFDPVNGNRNMRLSYCCSTPALDEALARLRRWLTA